MDECFIRYPKTDKWAEKDAQPRVFLNQLRSVGYLMKHSSSVDYMIIASQTINNS